MSIATRTNTIDFDSARLQRSVFALACGAEQPPLNLPSDSHSPLAPLPLDQEQLQHRLGLQLQTSLEAEKILSMFFKAVQPVVPLNALLYKHLGTDVRLELGERACHQVKYRMTHAGEEMGELIFQRSVRFADQELPVLEALLGSLFYPLRNALLYRHASLSAMRDPLTGAGNRMAMEQSLARETEVARRQLQPLSVLMLDIDHFQKIIDAQGQDTADQLLRTMTDAMKDCLRNIDQVFRYSEEKFVIVLSNTGREAARLVGERLRNAALQLDCPEEARAPADQAQARTSALEPTISLGCSTLLPGESPDSLLRRADTALYAARRQGRNRVEMAG